MFWSSWDFSQKTFLHTWEKSYGTNKLWTTSTLFYAYRYSMKDFWNFFNKKCSWFFKAYFTKTATCVYHICCFSFVLTLKCVRTCSPLLTNQQCPTKDQTWPPLFVNIWQLFATSLLNNVLICVFRFSISPNIVETASMLDSAISTSIASDSSQNSQIGVRWTSTGTAPSKSGFLATCSIDQ